MDCHFYQTLKSMMPVPCWRKAAPCWLGNQAPRRNPTETQAKFEQEKPKRRMTRKPAEAAERVTKNQAAGQEHEAEEECNDDDDDGEKEPCDEEEMGEQNAQTHEQEGEGDEQQAEEGKAKAVTKNLLDNAHTH